MSFSRNNSGSFSYARQNTASSVPKVYGGIIITRKHGVPLWQGWVERPNVTIQVKSLAKTITEVFVEEAEEEDSSFIDCGYFSVASIADAHYIVSILCTNACQEEQVLLKAKEVSHSVKMLFGAELGDMSLLSAEMLNASFGKTNLLDMMMVSRSTMYTMQHCMNRVPCTCSHESSCNVFPIAVQL